MVSPELVEQVALFLSIPVERGPDFAGRLGEDDCRQRGLTAAEAVLGQEGGGRPIS